MAVISSAAKNLNLCENFKISPFGRDDSAASWKDNAASWKDNAASWKDNAASWKDNRVFCRDSLLTNICP
jgi:hypothetical protein